MFSWSTVQKNFRANAEALEKFLRAIDAQTIHLVGHSLGGVLIRALFHYFPAQPPGRVVTWGSPHQGSLAAVSLARFAFGRWMLGASIAELLAGTPARWQPRCVPSACSAAIFPTVWAQSSPDCRARTTAS